MSLEGRRALVAETGPQGLVCSGLPGRWVPWVCLAGGHGRRAYSTELALRPGVFSSQQKGNSAVTAQWGLEMLV